MNKSNNFKQNSWDKSYIRGGNIVFYPNEEVIRFINRYIRKRRGISMFENILNLNTNEWQQFRCLDLGCGIGRHIKVLDEFGLNPYGIDISKFAINYAKEWFNGMNRQNVSEKILVGSVTKLPFNDCFFDMCISDSVLDSMPKDVAIQGINEIHRTLKDKGLVFLSLIMDNQKGNKEIVVDRGYEKGTIQTYYTKKEIKKLLDDKFEVINVKIISIIDTYYKGASVNRLNENIFLKEKNNNLICVSKRAYIVAKKRSIKNFRLT